jgi:hypothetical protein
VVGATPNIFLVLLVLVAGLGFMAKEVMVPGALKQPDHPQAIHLLVAAVLALLVVMVQMGVAVYR